MTTPTTAQTTVSSPDIPSSAPEQQRRQLSRKRRRHIFRNAFHLFGVVIWKRVAVGTAKRVKHSVYLFGLRVAIWAEHARKVKARVKARRAATKAHTAHAAHKEA